MAIIIDANHKIPCKCGCGQLTSGVRHYKNGIIYHPKHCHGHHKSQLGKSHPAWNKGLTKEICPTLSRMGYQKGHKPYNNWDKVNYLLKTDPQFKEKWRKAKHGNTAWNKGLSLKEYPNGIKRGKEHGNFKNGSDGFKRRIYPNYKRFIKDTLKRDNYTCKNCGKYGSNLNVHHIIPASTNISLLLEPSNVITLCVSCHKSIHSTIKVRGIINTHFSHT